MNREEKYLIQNLLCAEEHIVDMLVNAEDDYSKDKLINHLKATKENRVITVKVILEEMDENKWCLIKHLLLSQYHLLEIINSTGEKEERIKQLSIQLNNIEEMIDEILNNDLIKTNCGICKSDLIINKLFRRKG